MAVSQHDVTQLCRVCGGFLQKWRKHDTIYECKKGKDRLMATFGIDVSLDSETIHPKHYCNRCYSVTRRQAKATEEEILFRHATNVFEWTEHTEECCNVSGKKINIYLILNYNTIQVCEHLNNLRRTRGGSNKKATKNRGRPSRECNVTGVIREIKRLYDTHEQADSNAVYIGELPDALMCPICLDVLCQPVEVVPCGMLTCANCLCRWLQVSEKLQCPGCCCNHQLSEETIKSPTPVILDLLASLKMRCLVCGQITTIKNHKAHIVSKCQGYYSSEVPAEVSVRDLLSTPAGTPTQPMERRIAGHLVKRIIAESSESTGVLRLPTRGQVCHNYAPIITCT